MLDYEELLVLSSRKNRGRDGDNDGGRGILSKLRRKVDENRRHVERSGVGQWAKYSS